MNLTFEQRRPGRRACRAAPFASAAVLALAGCAAQAPEQGDAPEAAQADRAAAGQLYAGQPSIVHATQYPVASAAEGIARGDEAWRQGNLELAVYLYVQSLVYDGSAPEPLLKIAVIHEQLGNTALAAKAYEMALERSPDNAGARERLGLLYLHSGRYEDAALQLERAVALEPNRWRAYNGLGIAADRRKDYATAIARYDQALALEPKAASVMNNRGYSRFLAGDSGRAEADLRQAIELGASDGVWTNLGTVQASQGRYAEALESYQREMDSAQAYNLLGEGAFRRGDYLQARRYFESAITASPRYFEAAQKNLALVNERLAAPPSPLGNPSQR